MPSTTSPKLIEAAISLAPPRSRACLWVLRRFWDFSEGGRPRPPTATWQTKQPRWGEKVNFPLSAGRYVSASTGMHRLCGTTRRLRRNLTALHLRSPNRASLASSLPASWRLCSETSRTGAHRSVPAAPSPLRMCLRREGPGVLELWFGRRRHGTRPSFLVRLASARRCFARTPSSRARPTAHRRPRRAIPRPGVLTGAWSTSIVVWEGPGSVARSTSSAKLAERGPSPCGAVLRPHTDLRQMRRPPYGTVRPALTMWRASPICRSPLLPGIPDLLTLDAWESVPSLAMNHHPGLNTDLGRHPLSDSLELAAQDSTDFGAELLHH